MHPEREPQSFLPMLLPSREAVPLSDLARLEEFNRDYETMLELARAKNFTDTSVNNILASRTRLFAERTNAWDRVRVFNHPFAEFEAATADDEMRPWLKRTVMADIDEQARQNFGTVSDGKDPYYRRRGPNEELDVWFSMHGLYAVEDTSKLKVTGRSTQESDFKRKVRSSMHTWLNAQATVISEEAGAQFDGWMSTRDAEMITLAMEECGMDIHRLAFSQFDVIFKSHVTAGIETLRAMEPLQREESPRKRLIGRAVGRILNDKASGHMTDYAGEEYKVLGSFFGVSRSLTEFVTRLKNGDAAESIVAEFKRKTGFADIETFLKQGASRRAR